MFVRILLTVLAASALAGCQSTSPQPYGVEHRIEVPLLGQESWAVAPAINLSGEEEVDPILQGDILYQQLQTIGGMTAVPVDRVVQVFSALKIEKIESPAQAALVCDILGVKGLVIPTITAFDPYDPPKIGASLALFRKPALYVRPPGDDLAEIAQKAGQQNDPDDQDEAPAQAVGMFDSSEGSVRQALEAYAAGRNDPSSPLGARQYLVEMDLYNGFVYHQLIAQLLGVPAE